MREFTHEPILDALRRGDTAQALSAAQQAAVDHPLDPAAHRLLAIALRTQGEREAALAAIDRAIALAPDDANIHLERVGLLLDARELDEAQAELARTIGLDPNQFPAYIVKAQLAITRGDLDEAERLVRIASRIAPEHPHVDAVQGMLALRGGDPQRALGLLDRAARYAPQDTMVLYGLGFAYLANGHHAFAEQAFRALNQLKPSDPTRIMLAELMRLQNRPGEAADEIAPLANAPGAAIGMRRWAGELLLLAGRIDQALPMLRGAFEEEPLEARTLMALMEAWRIGGDADDGRQTIERALAQHPQVPEFWRARLMFEPFSGEAAVEVVERWMAAMPASPEALEARATIHSQRGEDDLAEAVSHRIVALDPGNSFGELRIIDALLKRDPDAAVARVEMLLARAVDPEIRRSLRQLLGRTLDSAGQPGAAAATWAELHAEVIDQRLPLPPLGDTRGIDWPAAAAVAPGTKGVLLLWGAPGSLVERLAVTLDRAGAPIRGDRYGPQPPTDPLQRYTTVAELLGGTLDPSYLINLWRAALPARGIPDGQIFDYLLWWDNALLLALRPHLPEAALVFAVRDPRDMLLDWLAFGSPAPFRLETPEVGAQWLAASLSQVADLHEQELFPHRILRLDEIAESPAGLAQALADTLQVSLPAPPVEALGVARYPAGHWRRYADTLGDAFALLTPIALRLGYPEA